MILTLKQYHQIKLRELRKGNLLVLDRLKPGICLNYIKPEEIKAIVVKHCYNAALGDPDVSSRKEIYRLPRQFVQHFIYKYLGKKHKTLQQIADFTGVTNHATVLNSYKVINNLYDQNYNGYTKYLYETIDAEILKLSNKKKYENTDRDHRR